MFKERPIFIIDGLNLFIRSFCSYPQMSANGEQMGGCVGFLKTLQRLSREFQPVQVYVAWEGGGSSRRRKIFPEYKLNRRPEKLNRFYEDDIPETDENRQKQLVSLVDILKNVPVCQTYVSDCEGDDIVAFMCRGPLRHKEKVIISSDKDMYQLLDEKTHIYSLHKKRFVAEDDVFDEFRIKAHNFALAKCLCGDVSDNIPGVKGLGFKTAAKKFPMLGGEQILLQDLLDFTASHKHESHIYQKIFESADIIKRNWKIIHLDGSMLSPEQMKRVEHVMNTFEPKVNKLKFIKSLLKVGITDFDTDNFFHSLICIEGLSYTSSSEKQ